MKEILIIAEYDKKDITDLTKEIVGAGKKFAQETGVLLSAVVLGEEYDHLGEVLASYGADLVYLGKDQALNNYNNEMFLTVLTNLIINKQPDVILCGMSVNGRELGSSLAARLKTVFISGVMGLGQNKAKELEVIRFKWEGKAQERINIKSPLPVILGFTPEFRGIEMPSRTADFKTELIDVLLPEKVKTRHVNTYVSDPGEVDLSEADLIIAGGNGMGSGDTFNLLKEAAALMGASLGGSRVALDKGWIPHNRMIGATGKIIRARVYLAMGISGAVQHMMGTKGCETVIAVNQNPRAEMMQAADLAVVGDVKEILPALIQQLKEHDKKGAEEQ